jgi:medium-chain acyl-[acyl-carrier-protein] hydrolase
VIYPQANPQARHRLFCFPYAGGNASIFRTWAEALAPDVEVGAIQLPGRSNRIQEPPFTWLPHLLPALLPALVEHMDKPFALFGHSMGALIAFETARHLFRQYDLTPVHLFVSARRAPHLPLARPPLHALPSAQFIQALQDLNGTPEIVLRDAEFMKFLLPLLRADFTLTETYVYDTEEPLSCPISVFGGTGDRLVKPRELEAWKQHTYGPFRVQMLPDGHFFLHSQQTALLDLIATHLSLSG